MRELKFRAYHKTAKQMLQEDYLGNCFQWLREGQPVAIMQYTGLKDKHGVEIYEGDMVEDDRDIYPYQIVFNKGMFHMINNQTAGDCLGYYHQRVEIIGNIWEHPELLEKK